MQRLTQTQYEELTAGAKTLESDEFGIKVLKCADGTVIKLFRLKRFFSTALFVPYATRFALATKKLAALGIPAVETTGLYYIPSIKRHIVTYPFLDGTTIRELSIQEETTTQRCQQVMTLFVKLFADMHEKGVFFRGAHLGNFVVRPNDTLGLIDVSNARFFRSLNVHRRAYNFKLMTKYQEDRDLLQRVGVQEVVGQYLSFAKLDKSAEQTFRKSLKDIAPIFA